MTHARMEYAALVAEVVGAAAVLVSVLYLAVQIADNTRELQIGGHYRALSLAQRPIEILLADQNLADIVHTGHVEPQALNASEWQQFSAYHLLVFNAWEYLFYSNLSESIPPSIWTGADAYYRNLVQSNRGAVQFWAENLQIYGEPFKSYVIASLPGPDTSASPLAADPRSLADGRGGQCDPLQGVVSRC